MKKSMIGLFGLTLVLMTACSDGGDNDPLKNTKWKRAEAGDIEVTTYWEFSGSKIIIAWCFKECCSFSDDTPSYEADNNKLVVKAPGEKDEADFATFAIVGDTLILTGPDGDTQMLFKSNFDSSTFIPEC